MKILALCSALGAASLTGCASTPTPPPELLQARAAYGRASRSPAATLALVDLHNAQGDLTRAEESFAAEPTSDATRDISYVAERRAQTVEARGFMLEADARAEAARRDGAALTRQSLGAAQRALASTQMQLQTTRLDANESQAQLTEERGRREAAERQAAAAMESLRRVASVREEQRGVVITLSGEVLFATGQSTLLPIAQRRLDQVARALIDQGARGLIVEGHTDARGAPAANQQLSLTRAQTVRAYLITRGIPDGAIQAFGLGATRPVASNDTAEGRANNRRVEIIVPPVPLASPRIATVRP
jgi:outer membrane protein OmpA-like peptidoglycan-associated protein